MTDNAIKHKSFSFAVRIVKLYKMLNSDNEYVISKQMLRSGTSIGANVREALNAESKADFIHKLAIAQKETDETIYWLELLSESGYIEKNLYSSFVSDCDEILRMLRSIILTSKANILNS